LAHELREAGLSVDRAFDARSIKAQLRAADRSGARVALIVGQEEFSEGCFTVRVLHGTDAHRQDKVARERLAGHLGEIARLQ
jgi:histidyl-tRNA synthetase